MSSEPPITLLKRLAQRPVPVLVGIVAGFLGCCVAGRLAAQQQPFENFVRFHQGIAPDSHFYPPFSQVLNLAREHAQPGKILVVIGGNSIFHGVGQRESQVWTHQLQELLGEDYVVLNLALRGNYPHEFGALVAERLVAEGLPVIFLTTSVHVGMQADYDGQIYRYFFWDAWGKGLVAHDERRDQWLEDEFYIKNSVNSPAREARYRGIVDGVVYSCDLWNAVAYHLMSTTWSPLMYPSFWKAHKNLKDNDPGKTLPFEISNRQENVALEKQVMLGPPYSQIGSAVLQGERDERLIDPYRRLPAMLVDRTLVVFRLEGVYYQERLSSEERELYLRFNRLVPRVVAQSGFHTQLVGEGYGIHDYFDRSHFSEEGGRKVATELAPTIRKMANQLYGTTTLEATGGKP